MNQGMFGPGQDDKRMILFQHSRLLSTLRRESRESWPASILATCETAKDCKLQSKIATILRSPKRLIVPSIDTTRRRNVIVIPLSSMSILTFGISILSLSGYWKISWEKLKWRLISSVSSYHLRDYGLVEDCRTERVPGRTRYHVAANSPVRKEHP